ncbi:MAG: hypothetical protein AB8F74_11520 [Saprospiraceae bacterium]
MQTNESSNNNFKYISNNRIPASESKSLIWWMIVVCFAYHYKVIACGLFGKMLGFEFICHTLIHGVTSNHWFEQLVYAPFLWYAFYRIICITFGPGENEVLGPKVRKLKTAAFFMLAMFIYGIGIHFTNTIEIYSRVYLGITDGALYDQVYWVDEQLSHWIQFFFFFLLFAWLIVHDRLDRTHGGYAAVFTGLLHGLERAIGVIEGDSPYIALVFGVWIVIACVIRWGRHDRDFPRVWQDFFFRHGLTFGLSMPVALCFYYFVFNGFVQPSAMGDEAWLVIAFVAIFTGGGFLLAVGLDKLLVKKVN